ncbi:MAG: recombinase family protein [Lachnospiraceae bacterium]|nr:recombinase family protein [Lachnospiraceae bacterium]
MSILKTVKKQLKNGEHINAVQYVRLEKSSKNREDKIIANNGTNICKEYLIHHPNICLVEKPYIDYKSIFKERADRKDFLRMLARLKDRNLNLVLVNDIYEFASSPLDIMATQYEMFEKLDVVVLDMKNDILYDSLEEFMKNLYSYD